MKSKSAEKIKLTSYDDLFGSSEVTAGEKVVSVPIRLFHTFKDHPFRVLDIVIVPCLKCILRFFME